MFFPLSVLWDILLIVYGKKKFSEKLLFRSSACLRVSGGKHWRRFAIFYLVSLPILLRCGKFSCFPAFVFLFFGAGWRSRRARAPWFERLAGARLGFLFVERGRKAGISHFRFFPHCLPFLLFLNDITVYYAQKNISLLHDIHKLYFMC